MTVMEKKSAVIMAMADHLTGQMIGAAVDDLLRLGAHGVQAIPSITKKDRQGILLLIEPGSAERAIGEYLARELKIGGYQRLETFHVFHETRYEKRTVTAVADGVEETFELRVKVVGPESAPFYTSMEADDSIRISQQLEKKGVIRNPHHIKGVLEAALTNGEKAKVML